MRIHSRCTVNSCLYGRREGMEQGERGRLAQMLRAPVPGWLQECSRDMERRGSRGKGNCRLRAAGANPGLQLGGRWRCPNVLTLGHRRARLCLGAAALLVPQGAEAPRWAPAPCSTHGLLLEKAESTQGAGTPGAPFPMLPGGRAPGQACFRSRRVRAIRERCEAAGLEILIWPD